MDVSTPVKPVKFRRWLPYWAVFQSDLRHTLTGWTYRVWVLASVLSGVGYLLYLSGVDRKAGIVQSASNFIGDLLRWSVLGSVTLIIALTGGSISGERGILADSVLSRGISRYQYFLGKWHARLVIVLGTFLAMGLAALLASYFLLHEDMKLIGCLIALATVSALLMVVTTCGVTTSAISNSTVLGIAVLWIVLYGLGFGLSLLPARSPTPDYALNNLHSILRGFYDWDVLSRLISYSAGGSFVVALVGLIYFARRDV
jgi:hypothetical protein